MDYKLTAKYNRKIPFANPALNNYTIVKDFKTFYAAVVFIEDFFQRKDIYFENTTIKGNGLEWTVKKS